MHPKFPPRTKPKPIVLADSVFAQPQLHPPVGNLDPRANSLEDIIVDRGINEDERLKKLLRDYRGYRRGDRERDCYRRSEMASNETDGSRLPIARSSAESSLVNGRGRGSGPLYKVDVKGTLGTCNLTQSRSSPLDRSEDVNKSLDSVIQERGILKPPKNEIKFENDDELPLSGKNTRLRLESNAIKPRQTSGSVKTGIDPKECSLDDVIKDRGIDEAEKMRRELQGRVGKHPMAYQSRFDDISTSARNSIRRLEAVSILPRRPISASLRNHDQTSLDDVIQERGINKTEREGQGNSGNRTPVYNGSEDEDEDEESSLSVNHGKRKRNWI